MDIYQNILVVIDPTTDEQKALKRAIELVSKLNSNNNNGNAKLTAFFSIFDFSYEMTTILSNTERDAMRSMVIKEKQEWLDDVINKLNADIEIRSHVVWHNRPFEAIINQVIEHNYDLVIKGTHQHDKFKSVVFTPTDWHLLRKCPSPVLLVKNTNGQKTVISLLLSMLAVMKRNTYPLIMKSLKKQLSLLNLLKLKYI